MFLQQLVCHTFKDNVLRYSLQHPSRWVVDQSILSSSLSLVVPSSDCLYVFKSNPNKRQRHTHISPIPFISMVNRSRSASVPVQGLQRRNAVRRASVHESSETRHPSPAGGSYAADSSQAVAQSAHTVSDEVPDSPPPRYTRLTSNINIVDRPELVIHTRELSPVSVGSLPDYDSVPAGPPTDIVGYHNYVIPGMEVPDANRSDLGNLWEYPNFWVSMPYVTDPLLPPCEGMHDGTCPAVRLGPHGSGLYYNRCSAPSALLREALAELGSTEDVFEGGNPPEEIWKCLIWRVLRRETEASEHMLNQFCWYHCPGYRERVIGRRHRLDVTRSVLYLRRQRTRFWRGIGALPHRTDLSPIEGIEETEANSVREAEARSATLSTEQQNRADSGDSRVSTVPIENEGIEQDPSAELQSNGEADTSSTFVDLDDFFHNSGLEISLEADADSPLQTTEVNMPANTFDYRSAYLRYGFMPPSAPAPVHGSLPTYPLCTSPHCPLAHIAHRQGPWREPGIFGYPWLTGTGPDAARESELAIDGLRNELRGLGLGALFPDDCVPPPGIWLGVLLVVQGTAAPGDLEYVEAFRYFHCRGTRSIVEDGEELGQEEGDGELSPPTSPLIDI